MKEWLCIFLNEKQTEIHSPGDEVPEIRVYKLMDGVSRAEQF